MTQANCCPYLRSTDNTKVSSENPFNGAHCGALYSPLRLSISQQEDTCFNSKYYRCIIYTNKIESEDPQNIPPQNT